MFSTRKNKKIYVTVGLILFSLTLFSQRGKDGAGVISAANTIVNTYATLTSNANGGVTTVINVSSAAGILPGDLLYIIQVQGASVNCYPEAANPNNSQPAAFNYGRITNYNNAGNNEYAEVYSVSGNNITLDCALTNSYTAAGKVQVIKVPRYSSLIINAGASISCPVWNGSTGGVIALEVLGNTTVTATGSINATATGFRGGFVTNKQNSAFGGGAWGHLLVAEGASKGESIAGDTVLYGSLFAGKRGKGAVANGGGGGAAVNGGGGGGANGGDTSAYINGFGVPDISTANFITAWNLEAPGTSTVVSSGGGRGGYTFSNSNSSPLTTAPGNGAWAGDNRRVQGGLGGRPLNYNSGRLYMGGGGGAGDHDNNYGGRGGVGGGIISFISYGDISGGGIIISDGENGANSNTTGNAPFNNCNGRDGAGGGGGGGAILLKCDGSISTVTVSARGGNGGLQQMKSGFIVATGMAYGPGGGGGGGYIGTTAAITTSVNGGVNGIVQYLSGAENCQIDNLFPPNGSTAGNSGTTTATIFKNFTITVNNATVCANTSATLLANSNDPSPGYNWYSAQTGATLLGTGAIFTSSVLTTPGTYTVWLGKCPGTYREPAVITVVGSPTIGATSATVCGTQTAVLTATGATTYTWNTSATTATIAVSPTTTTIYTVVGTSAAGCTAQATSTVTTQNSATLSGSASSTVLCANQTITINTVGSPGTYTWSNGAGNTPSITVTTAGSYSAFLTTACGSTMYAVDILDGPSVSAGLSASANTVCAGGSVTLTATGSGTNAWSTGTVNTNSVVVGSAGIYTVTYANICGSATASFQVINGPQPTVNIVATQTTFCTGQTATLIANGAATYTWISPISGPVNGSVFTTAAAGVYTLNGSTQCGNSSAQVTVTFQVSPDISVVASKVAVCPGDTATLRATNLSGGGNFIWSTSANTTNIETVLGGGTYTASYVNGCGVASATVAIIQSTLTPDFVPSTTSGVTPLNVTFNNTSFSYTLSQWNYGNGAALGNTQHGSAVYTAPGIYTITLIIQNLESCLASISKTIEVINVPFGIIPELLSPNGDGKNDRFEIKGLEQFTNCELEIFNRWGNKVYGKAPYDNSFDGTPNFKSVSGKLPTGTYFYILRLGDADNKVFNGYFQLAY